MVSFSKTWSTAHWHGHTLARSQRVISGNFYDVDSGEEYWLSGPKRDRTDTRYSNAQPTVDADVAEIYEAFLRGASLPGRENG